MKILSHIKSRYGQRGDTIIEVLVSMTVLTLVLTVTYVSTSDSLHNGTDSSNRQQAVAFAEQQVEFIKTAPASYQASNFCVQADGTAPTPTCVFNTQYTISDTYDSASGLYTITAKWPSSHAGGSQLSVYYRIPKVSVTPPPPPPPVTGGPAIAFCVDDPAVGSACNSSDPNSSSPSSIYIDNGASTTMHWNVSGGAATCTTSNSPAWSGPSKDGGGSTSTGALSGGAAGGSGAAYTYSITCTNSGGTSGPQSVSIHVNAPPPPPPPGTGSGGNPVNCNDLAVNFTAFSVSGNTVTYTAVVQGHNPCGQFFTQCNLLNSGGGSIAQINGNGSTTFSNQVTGAGYGATSYMSCQTEGYPVNSNGIGFSNRVNQPPPPPAPQIAIMASGPWEIVGGNTSSPCEDVGGGHHWFVCVSWASSSSVTGPCVLHWVSNNGAGNVDESNLPTNHDTSFFVLGFVNVGQPDGTVQVSCANHSSPVISPTTSLNFVWVSG